MALQTMQMAPSPGLGGAGLEAPLLASAPPLDYSFKELKFCVELETEEPRGGNKRTTPEHPKEPAEEPGEDPEAAAADAAATGGALGGTAAAPAEPAMAASAASMRALAPRTGAPIRKVVTKTTTTVKLNNNMLESLSGLALSLEVVMISPIVNLQWIDLSYNHLTTIERELERFLNLKALYLHGNLISRMAAVDKLRRLPKLLSLTLNGNPIGEMKSYRDYVCGVLPNLRSLDHSTITPDEAAKSQAWYKGYQERAKKRAEDKQFNMGSDD